MKSLILVFSFLSTTAIAGYNGKVMIICDTAKTQYAIVESANNIQIKGGKVTLTSKTNVGEKEETTTRTLDLKETVECRFEAESGSELQK
jgi:hypothetical protein